jgi:hypothetical protein
MAKSCIVLDIVHSQPKKLDAFAIEAQEQILEFWVKKTQIRPSDNRGL